MTRGVLKPRPARSQRREPIATSAIGQIPQPRIERNDRKLKNTLRGEAGNVNRTIIHSLYGTIIVNMPRNPAVKLLGYFRSVPSGRSTERKPN